MSHSSRREFCAQVGRGMLVAGLGSGLAQDLGLAGAAEEPGRLTFGPRESLVALMQETPPDQLLPALVGRLRDGTDLGELVAAGALANARAFGGEDYIGFHTIMALAPALRMARELPDCLAPLPVLKVLYRNSSRLQAAGFSKKDTLAPVEPASQSGGAEILAAVKRKDLKAAEATLAAAARQSPEEAFNQVMEAVADGQEVHRIVMPYRSWDLLDIVGKEHAQTLLRQSVHYCVKQESPRYSGYFAKARALLPKLLDQFKLADKPLGTKPAEDQWVDDLCQTIFKGPPERAAEAVAAALAEGFAPDAIGEAISLAANQLVLRDNGRLQFEVSTNKPLGSVHGDSIGVHACDSANAWRNIARVSNARNAVACLILGAYQASQDRLDRGGNDHLGDPYPRTDARERIQPGTVFQALRQLDAAIENRDQALASAVVDYCGREGLPARAVFQRINRQTISADGALHGEKFYRTVTEEFAATRPAFRWRHLVALARVTASSAGYAAPGLGKARELLEA